MQLVILIERVTMPEREEVFTYLDKLRESGVTNMFGAAPYLERKYGLGASKAREFLSQWMQTFGERHPQ